MMNSLEKIIITLLMACCFHSYSQDVEEVRLWNLRMEQNAKESFLFWQFTEYNDSTFPKSTGLLSKNDTIRYASGKIFRTCQVSQQKLNGTYLIYYPNGQVYCKEKYAKGYPCDTAYYYSSSGLLKERSVWLNEKELETSYYTEEGLVKKKYVFKYSSKLSEAKGIPKFKEKRFYYDKAGRKISKEEYYKIYGDTKDKL